MGDAPPPVPGRPNPHVALAMKLRMSPSTPHAELVAEDQRRRTEVGLFAPLEDEA